MASTINASTSPAAIIQTADGTGILALQTAGTTALTIDASQNVGIGTATPTRLFDVSKTTGDAGVAITSSTTGQSSIFFADTDINVGMIYYEHTNDAMGFRTNDAERMRIDSSGNLIVGTTATFISIPVNVQGSGSSGQLGLRNSGATAGKYWSFGPNASNNIVCYNNSSVGVYIVDGGTSWTGTSDERLKTNLQPIENAAEKVSTLRAVTGRFIADEENKSRAFLIAQDVQKVLPEAVDASDPEKLGIAYTDVIPLLVAAIQEQQTLIVSQSELINSLTARVTALEAK